MMRMPRGRDEGGWDGGGHSGFDLLGMESSGDPAVFPASFSSANNCPVE